VTVATQPLQISGEDSIAAAVALEIGDRPAAESPIELSHFARSE